MANKYRIAYATAAHSGQPSGLIHVDIYNPAETTHTLVEIEGAEKPLTVAADNSGEDKFDPAIRGQKATIQFHSNSTVNLLTFMSGNDNSWLVDAYVVSTNKRIFKGFLVQDDISEAFQPTPNVVTLTAGDGLGLLKDEPLTMPNGDTPRQHALLIDYISWCLQKTGLQLPLYVVNNIKGEHDQTKIFYRTTALHPKTFEDEIGTCIDCYNVLEAILGESCYLTQYDGAWWIVRIDELNTDAVLAHKFTYAGVFQETLTVNVDQFIGTGRAMYWINEDAELKPSRPMKEVRETYTYDYPIEIIDNIDFSRGDEVAVDGEEHYYNIDDWEFAQWSAHNNSMLTGLDAHIYRKIVDGYEKERYIILPNATGLPQLPDFNRWAFLRSNPIPMGAGDKGAVSVEFRKNVADHPDHNEYVSVMVLTFRTYTNKYYVVAADGAWIYKAADTSTGAGVSHVYNSPEESAEWQSMTIDFKPVPEDGELYVFLEANYNGLQPEQTLYYQNLNLDYKPYINGSYSKYKGQYHKISQPITSKQVRKGEVKMSDATKPLFKGAMFKVTTAGGFTFTSLADRFYSAYHQPIPSEEHYHPYGHLQAFDVWNQHNRLMRVFEGTIQGLQVNGTLPGLIHKYRLTDITSHTVNKYFILLHGEFDWYLCEWRGTLAEVWDSTIPKDYDSAKEFKYVEG
jgi:hypothetical protein